MEGGAATVPGGWYWFRSLLWSRKSLLSLWRKTSFCLTLSRTILLLSPGQDLKDSQVRSGVGVSTAVNADGGVASRAPEGPSSGLLYVVIPWPSSTCLSRK